VPNKLLGLGLILGYILCVIFLPFICKNFIIRSTMFRPFYGIVVWFFIFVCLLLGWIGSLPVISPFIEIGQMLTFLYFFILLFLFPFIGLIEKYIYYTYIYRFYKENENIQKNNIRKQNIFLNRIIYIFIVYFLYNFINVFYNFINIFYNFIRNNFIKIKNKWNE